MDQGARKTITELETTTLGDEPRRVRKRPGPKPRGKPGPKPKATGPLNGHGASPVDPMLALKTYLGRLDAEAKRLDAEATRVKRALAALER